MEITTANDAFSAVSTAAPYVIAAYAALWATMVVYLYLVMRRLNKLEAEVAVVEAAVARRSGGE
jgi:CcmD family protein